MISNKDIIDSLTILEKASLINLLFMEIKKDGVEITEQEAFHLAAEKLFKGGVDLGYD